MKYEKLIKDQLHKKPTLIDIIHHIQYKQPTKKYPDRRATFIRNSPYLSQYDGDSWIDIEEQEKYHIKRVINSRSIKKDSRSKWIYTRSITSKEFYTIRKTNISTTIRL